MNDESRKQEIKLKRKRLRRIQGNKQRNTKTRLRRLQDIDISIVYMNQKAELASQHFDNNNTRSDYGNIEPSPTQLGIIV
jgi:hypothetical protein